MANHAVNTPSASIARRYLFRVTNPATHNSMTIAADTPDKALSVYSQWFAVPTNQIAINRRSPMQEVAHA